MSGARPSDLLKRLQGWVDAGALRSLDLALTRFIHRQAPEEDPAVLLAVALASARNGHGHVCLDLAAVLERPELALSTHDGAAASSKIPWLGSAGALAGLDPGGWAARLARSRAVESRLARLDSDPPWRADGEAVPYERDVAPFVLDGIPERPLLYLRRYWEYETRIRQGIAERLCHRLDPPEPALRELLDLLFAPGSGSAPDSWQRIACALAARSAFAIITGGPGTGKTTTVVRLLALLQGLTLEQGGQPLRIRLAAPTGKAAARLNESIAARVRGLPFASLPSGERLRHEIPTEVSTVHRLLGTIPESRRFRHRASNPLPADLVVVDEASMVDVELLAALLEAMRPDARLILLGDKDQLASVEAGAVLGDLCRRARRAHYSPETCDWIQRVAGTAIPSEYRDPDGQPLDQAVVMLRSSYRFKAEGGIGALAELVNEGFLDRQLVMDRLAAMQTLLGRPRRREDASLGLIDAIRLTGEADRALDRLAIQGYRGYLERMRASDPGDDAQREALDDWAREVLDAYGGFQLLTALREGPWGAQGLNARIVAALGDLLGEGTEPWVSRPGPADGVGHWLHGRPVLVTRNDYGLRLMNGDIGIALSVSLERPDGSRHRALRVAFPAGDGSGGIRWILPSRLQSVETVFAMTVHKSQGSEFTHTALVLPDTPSPVLTRELFYTGITRSRERFTLLYSRDEVLRQTLEQRIERVSGFALPDR